jgi:mandelate racemase
MAPEQAADEAEELLAGGFRAVKLRLGRSEPKQDLAAVRAVRRRLPDGVALMVDYNQALTVAEAIARGGALDGEGLYWIEEPIRHDDYSGNAAITRALKTPIQIGENFSGPHAMATAIAAGASDYVMPDLERIGGITGWQRAAALAMAAGIEMSSHLFPEVSAHLLAGTPTCHWLEYVDWAAPLLQEPLRIEDGLALVPERPGTGLVWDEAAVARFRMA